MIKLAQDRDLAVTNRNILLKSDKQAIMVIDKKGWIMNSHIDGYNMETSREKREAQ